MDLSGILCHQQRQVDKQLVVKSDESLYLFKIGFIMYIRHGGVREYMGVGWEGNGRYVQI